MFFGFRIALLFALMGSLLPCAALAQRGVEGPVATGFAESHAAWVFDESAVVLNPAAMSLGKRVSVASNLAHSGGGPGYDGVPEDETRSYSVSSIDGASAGVGLGLRFSREWYTPKDVPTPAPSNFSLAPVVEPSRGVTRDVWTVAASEEYRDNFLIGVNVNYIRETSGRNAGYVTGDVAGIYSYAGDLLKVAVIGHNLNSVSALGYEKSMTLGLASQPLPPILLLYQADWELEDKAADFVSHAFGGELRSDTRVGAAMRGGFRADAPSERNYWSVGASAYLGPLWLSYGYKQEVGNGRDFSHQVGLELRTPGI